MSVAIPDAALLEAEAELQALVVEIETLNALWPAAEPATRRTKIGAASIAPTSAWASSTA